MKKSMKNENEKQKLVTEIRSVKKLLSKGWTRGTMARDSSGRLTFPNSDKAMRFCLLGALSHLSTSLKTAAFLKESYPWLAHFNDNSTKAEVLRFLDERIADAKKLLIV